MKQFSLKLRKILLCDIFYIILLVVTIIYVVIYVKKYIPPTNYDINSNIFILTIDEIKKDGNKLSLSFKENLIGKYKFDTKKEKDNFNYQIGDKLKIMGTLEVPKNNTIPNTFNYKKYLYHSGIEYILNIEKYELYSENKNILNSIKNFFINRISNIKNNDYLYAFILGKSNYISEESYNNYKINGVTHLFALSGLHVSMFSSILLFILKKIKLKEKQSFIITSVFLIFFSFIASFTPSILRATIFFVLSGINKIYYFYIKPKNLLYLTFIILEIINPNYIFSLGFILSFTITYFILLMNENIIVNNKTFGILVVSIISVFSSLPIIINMSYEINIIGFINNIVFIPLVTYLIFPLSLLTLIFPFLSGILNVLTNVMENISSWSSSIFNMQMYFQCLRYFEIIIYYILFILIIKKRRKFIVLFLLFIIYLYVKPKLDKSSYIYFIDVAQGDSALIVSENNNSILIDTGGIKPYVVDAWEEKNRKFNLMSNSMIPFFKSIGLKKIDYLFLTHGDDDHSGNAKELVSKFKTNKIFINKGNINLLEKDYSNNIIVDNYIKIDNIQIYSLNNKVYNNENDNSMVLLVKIYNYQILFMADASVSVEKDILNKYNLKNIDIIKIGHHGSNTSTSELLLDRTTPKEAIISVALNNKYNHPSKSTLNLLNNKNIKYYSTSIYGTIKYTITKNNIKLNTYNP